MVDLSNLKELAPLYLSQRRKFGYKYGKFEMRVYPYLDFLESQGKKHISLSSVLEWRSYRNPISNSGFAGIYGYIRGLSIWANHIDDRNEVLPTGFFGGSSTRANVYFYSTEDINGLMKAALARPSRFGLRGFTTHAFIGLLATTGLRIEEALELDDGDVDLDNCLVTIRETKSRYSRVIPIQRSTKEALSLYKTVRDVKAYRLNKKSNSFFMSERGTRPSACRYRLHVYHAMDKIGLRKRISAAEYTTGPRVHDFRHSFAIRTMINWYEEGLNPNDEILKLTNFLGHTHARDTYWYLEAVPELLHYVVKRMEGTS